MLQEDIKISVLMSVYDTPVNFLREALDSILNQTHKNIEFVIINDGSAETSVIECLAEYADKDDRIVLIINDENVGLTKSLNIGLKSCTGKYIARMDSDDISEPGRLEKQLAFMEKEENRAVSLVGSDILIFGEDCEETDTSKNPGAFDDLERHRVRSLFEHSGPPHPTFFIRKSFLDDNNICYREEDLKAQDYGLMTDIYIKDGVIDKIKEPLLRYRIHKAQITGSSFDAQKNFQMNISKEYLRFRYPELSDKESEILASLTTPFKKSTIFGYKKAINKILSLNEQSEVYNQEILIRELDKIWNKKKKKMMKILRFFNK